MKPYRTIIMPVLWNIWSKEHRKKVSRFLPISMKLQPMEKKNTICAIRHLNKNLKDRYIPLLIRLRWPELEPRSLLSVLWLFLSLTGDVWRKRNVKFFRAVRSSAGQWILLLFGKKKRFCFSEQEKNRWNQRKPYRTVPDEPVRRYKTRNRNRKKKIILRIKLIYRIYKGICLKLHQQINWRFIIFKPARYLQSSE